MSENDRYSYDVVVVGASTRPPLASRLLGSVPRELVQQSPCPVLVLPAPR